SDQPERVEESGGDLVADVEPASRRAPLALEQSDVAVSGSPTGEPEPVPLEHRTVKIERLPARFDRLFRYRRNREQQFRERIPGEIDEQEHDEGGGHEHED